MPARPTFEDATKNVLINSQFRLYANGERESTTWNWIAAYEEDRAAAHELIDNLCDDLAIVTGEKIKRFSKLSVEIHLSPQITNNNSQWVVGVVPVQFQVEVSWNSFLKRFPAYVNKAISSLQAEPEPSSPFIYKLNKVWWDKGDACTRLPDCMDMVKFIHLITPNHLSIDAVEKPDHIKEKLELLQNTHYDYQPYILQGRKGGMLLVLKLGCQWPDVAIATWDQPPSKIKNLSNCLIAISLGSFFLSMLCLYGYYFVENTFFQVITGIVAGLTGTISCVFASFFVAKKFKPLKV